MWPVLSAAVAGRVECAETPTPVLPCVTAESFDHFPRCPARDDWEETHA